MKYDHFLMFSCRKPLSTIVIPNFNTKAPYLRKCTTLYTKKNDFIEQYASYKISKKLSANIYSLNFNFAIGKLWDTKQYIAKMNARWVMWERLWECDKCESVREIMKRGEKNPGGWGRIVHTKMRGQGALNGLIKWHINLLKITARVVMGWQPIMHPLALKNIPTNSNGLPIHDAPTSSTLDTHF